MSGCGGNCACASGEVKKDTDVCVPDGKKVVLDEHGKCPCGKATAECCHKDAIEPPKNEALGELCRGGHGPDVC